MVPGGVILAIDQGTTATKALLVDLDGRVTASAGVTLEQIYPQPGWVETDPDLLWNSIRSTCGQVLAGVSPREVVAIGLSNQGESVIAWDRESGRPLYNVISWQDTRTEADCRALARQGDMEKLREKTGLILDSYLSASKFSWLLTHVPAVQEAYKAGRLLLGNLDAWMLWKISNGRIFATDYSTASRTLLFNVHTLAWDEDLLTLFDIPGDVLPRPIPCSGPMTQADPEVFLGLEAPLTASAVDQPAALFGHGCEQAGSLKITYGTGAFLLMNTGGRFHLSEHGLLTSIAATPPDRPVQYYLDGGIYSAGGAIQWLRNQAGVADCVEELAALADGLPDNGGVYFVPALVGLAAPHWQREVAAAFFGLTRATGRPHMVRAVLEAIAYRVCEIVRSMEQDTGQRITAIRADGGVSANTFLMQFQADLLGVPVTVPDNHELTGLGIARLAGLGADILRPDASFAAQANAVRYSPAGSYNRLQSAFARWRQAVKLARAFSSPG